MPSIKDAVMTRIECEKKDASIFLRPFLFGLFFSIIFSVIEYVLLLVTEETMTKFLEKDIRKHLQIEYPLKLQNLQFSPTITVPQ